MSATEVLEGELLEIVREVDDGSWAVARIALEDGGEATVVGPLGSYAVGLHMRLTGFWTNHKRFGKQFRVQTVLQQDPKTLEGLVRYLSSEGIPGLGPKLVERTVERFGLETLHILTHEPERLTEVKGIGEKKAEEVLAHWERERSDREVMVLLRSYQVGDAVARRVVTRYGDQAAAILREDPYRLTTEIEGVAFRTADAIARGMGMSADDPRRARAAVAYLLREAEGEGHCFLPLGELVRRATQLSVSAAAVAAAVDEPVLQRTLVLGPATDPESRPVYRAQVERRERKVAEAVAARCNWRKPEEDLARSAELRVGLELNEEQRRAVATALAHDISVITGGPGTGKTTIVKVLMEATSLLQQTWALAAPTGRAARRLAESCGREGMTLHRLLEYSMQTRSFQRSRAKPLEVHGVLVDEASMLDLALMSALLDALPDDAKLVLVGDADQLPSVGAGQVLRDLIDCGEVPIVSLHQVYRQADGSGIVRNAHRVLRGEMPVSGESETDAKKDFFVLARQEPEDVVATLIKVMTERMPALGFEPRADVQVLTPMRRGPLGTRALNQALQEALNPNGAEIKRGGKVLRAGDRVIQIRNDYDNDVFNGDVGRVIGVSHSALDVDFDGRRVLLTGEELDRVELAYAISIHKSQGSEYPAVVVLLHGSHFVMLRRNLLYTAMTRARSFCCVIGAPWALGKAVSRAGGSERWTGLRERIRSA
ncbi:MAG: ATP-dependent RecD-like DNA helicase [Alphaproteobacteria bacterium]|nr:ATP-dependent RecD-like DNA helicase [Alphaproteobacteria bacterium]MCB9796807.1 ATP-dependent RecD-like DNA helicase [Alphaproteobacteria bacterium]